MSIASIVKTFYDSELKHQLENSKYGHFVAIHPHSKD